MQNRSILKIISALIIISINAGCSDTHTVKEDARYEIILFDGLENERVSAVSENLAANYDRITKDLRVENMPKIEIKIWANYNNFLDAMERDLGTRYNGATGYVYGPSEIRLYYNSQVSVAAVHEFAHLVSMQVNISIPNNPRWLWEAVALYENNEFVNPQNLPYMAAGNFPTLSTLNRDFNSSNHSIYDVGYILLEYVAETWGMDAVIELIRTNGNIPYTLNISTEEFESGWYNFVMEKYFL